MQIGVPKEIKDNESRVGMTPAGVARLVAAGSQVSIEAGAGSGSGYGDTEYKEAGARLVNASEAWDCDLVVKVKEPLPEEYCYLSGQMLFTFLHLAGVDKELTQRLLKQNVTALAYETLKDSQGRLPLLAPMSAIAGNMSTLMGAYYLSAFNGGRGVQLASVLGSRSGEVLVIGDGVAGQHAARVAVNMGATVYLAGLNDQNYNRLRKEVHGELRYLPSTVDNIGCQVQLSDLVIGAILVPGKRAVKVITEGMVKSMRNGSVVVDISIDQGGCVETSRPTTHSDPVFRKHDVTHYCVTNMPGAYPRTATNALSLATVDYVEKIATFPFSELIKDSGFAESINIRGGYVAQQYLAEELGIPEMYRPVMALK